VTRTSHDDGGRSTLIRLIEGPTGIIPGLGFLVGRAVCCVRGGYAYDAVIEIFSRRQSGSGLRFVGFFVALV
jgi:hypothetical protein